MEVTVKADSIQVDHGYGHCNLCFDIISSSEAYDLALSIIEQLPEQYKMDIVDGIINNFDNYHKEDIYEKLKETLQ